MCVVTAPIPPPTPPGWYPLPPLQRRRRLWPTVLATAVAALVVGGLTGGVIGYATGRSSESTAGHTVNATIAAVPDPVCAEWEAQSHAYAAKTEKWSKSDPSVPESSWTSDTRALNMSIIPVLQAEAADMRRLADKAQDAFLASLMRAQATYEEAYAARVPNYQPSDDDLWQAASTFNDSVGAVCQTTAPH